MSQYLAPSFIIIGGVKCGTSSLYRYLNLHPNVLPCKSKEPNYFSFRKWYQIPFSYRRYRRMFPHKEFIGKIDADWLDLGADEKMHASSFSKNVVAGKQYITGEATATTFFAAHPKLIKFLLPDLKLIMMLRHPTDRYVSHFRMYERFKKEGRKGYDFKPLVPYIEEEISLYKSGKKTRILHQGLYAKHLEKWVKVFGKDRLLLLKTTDFEEVVRAQAQMTRICEYLGLADFDFSENLNQKYNRAPNAEIPLQAKQYLDEFYRESLTHLSSEYAIDL